MTCPTKKFDNKDRKRVWTFLSRSLMILQAISLVAGLIFVLVQLKNIANNQELALDQAKIEQDLREIQFLREFKKELTSGINYGIYTSLVHKKPILRENGGSFTTDDLKEYLSVFNQLSLVTDRNFVDGGIIYSFFYYYISYTFENQEIQDYLKLLREYSPGRFSGLDRLYAFVTEY